MNPPSVDPLDRFRLEGRTAVVTGASAGFGERFARVLAAAGAEVVVTARRAERLRRLAEEIGGRAVVADLTVEEDRARIAGAVGDRVDILVNNAGIATGGRPEDYPVEEFRRTFEVNVVAPFALTQLLAGPMLARGSGSVIMVASVTALVSSIRGRSAAYSASKSALLSLTRNLAVAWARKGVRVNALAPSWFPTEMTEANVSNPAWLEQHDSLSPMGRMGREGELDGALLFLASDASTFVTGQAIVVDGGWSAT
jgi:NAD(P)-dependent dehydrogenase (short-subunit alcohol dehydrogenase family)